MVIQISLKNYPQELIKGRESAEATFVFCLWKQPDLFDDFQRINTNDDQTLKTEDGTFYFSLGRQMYNQGFRSFDNVTIYLKISLLLKSTLMNLEAMRQLVNFAH